MSARGVWPVTAALVLVVATPLTAQSAPATHSPPDSVTIRIVATELRSAVQIMQQYLDRPVIYSGAGVGPQVTLETPRAVPRADIPRLLRALLESQGFELVNDTVSGTYRARAREPARATPASTPGFTTSQSVPRAPAQSPELFVIPLKHVRAVDVATTLNALFGKSANTNNAAAGRPQTLSDELRANQVPPVPPVDAPQPQAMPGAAGRSATLSGELTIVPDSRANNLLLRANRPDFELIQAAVQQIDVRPPQALIEVLIIEAQRDRSFSLGIDASVADTRVDHTQNTTVGGELTPGNAGLGDFTLRVMGISGFDLGTTITAAAGRGDVKIVSRPTVLTANDEEAEVIVGSQRPFVQVSRTLPTDNSAQDQVVQYKDVGTKLTVRPTISIDGTVQLHVVQEVSNATTETQFNAPVISTRSIRTDLLVKDGQTIVLGGLTDSQHDVETEGIPLLSSIPFIGGLFGRQSRSSTETELFIFLTPRVIRTDEDAQRLTDPLRNRAKKNEP